MCQCIAAGVGRLLAATASGVPGVFVHPAFRRRGVASLILNACEEAAIHEGFTRLEMGATLTGVPFYKSRGYEEREPPEGRPRLSRYTGTFSHDPE